MIRIDAHLVATLGEWMHSGARPRPAPHGARVGSVGAVWVHPVWGDAARTVLVAYEDEDGCQALVRTVHREADR